MIGQVAGIVMLSLSVGADVEADYVLRGAQVFDGKNEQLVKADVAIKGDRIVAVGEFKTAGQPRVLDVTGMVVAPGFIDLHTHSDFTITDRSARGSVNFLMQGVTTVVTGNCGLGRPDVGTYYKQVEEGGTGTNMLHLIPQGSVRKEIMGVASRAPTAEELESMRRLVERGMREGAWGLSTGLSYLPGSFSSTEELIVLARAAGAQGGIYVSHIRNQGSQLHDAINEALEIGKQAGVPVHLSHLKIAGAQSRGTAAAALRLIDEARRQGREVTADQYPYHASSTSLIAMVIPPIMRSQGDFEERLANPDELPRIRAAIARRVETRDGPERLVVATFAHRRDWQGKSLAELVKQEKKSATDLALYMLQHGGAKMISFSMGEEDVRQIMQASYVATASDGRARDIGTKDLFHPRDFGTFPRKIGTYAIEKKVMPLGQALRSATGLPADVIQLPGRGYLRAGYFADIVVFDPKTFRDKATFDEPRRHANGVSFLFVNGKLAVNRGEATGSLAGRVLRHASK
ncbi:MAG: amidohydrolase family protein [Gemmataceae bacterium]